VTAPRFQRGEGSTGWTSPSSREVSTALRPFTTSRAETIRIMKANV
jgi:hypothetical protein